MRRGQLLSLDALIATVMVILLLSMVSATSENLRSGITGLIDWYDRTNLPDTMLDVLFKSPGEPANWSENVSLLVVPGLESETGQYVDYERIIKFMELAKEEDSRVIGFLKNLSLGRNFQLEIYLNEETVSASLNYLIVSEYGNPANESAQSGGLQVVFQNLTITHNYTANWFEPDWNGFAMINGRLVSNSNPEVNSSKEEASWISYSERKIVLRKLVYATSYVLPKGTRDRELYGGMLKSPLPTYSTLSVEIPNEDGNVSILSIFSNETMRGYGVLAVVRSGNKVLYLVEKTIFQGSAKVTKVCNSVSVNNSFITVPWSCLIEPSGGVIFSVWAHEVGFTNVTVADSGSLDMYMAPVSLIGKVKLWVWDER